MNQSLRYLFLSASVAAAASAAPFMAIGDGAELFVTGVLQVRADDNVLLANDTLKDGDLIFDVAPGLELDFGKNAQFQGALTASGNFIRYVDHDDLDTELFNADLLTRYDDGKTKLNFNVGYHELYQNSVGARFINPSTGGLLRRDIINVAATTEVEYSELFSIGGGLLYDDTSYEIGRPYVDATTATIPVNLYYKLTPKIDLSVGFQYRDYSPQTSGITNEAVDHFYNVGARGEFTPKLTGKVAIGVTKRRLGNLGNRETLGLDSSLAYDFSPKTNLQVAFVNDVATSPLGEQQRNAVVNAMVTTRLNEEWAFNAGASYRRMRYDDGTDDFYEALLGATYIINAHVKLNAGYVFRTFESAVGAGSIDFDNNVFSLSANLRY